MGEHRIVRGILGDVGWTRCADSGWWRARFPTVMSGPVIRYRLNPEDNHDEVSASRDGVCVRVITPLKGRDTAKLATVIGRAAADWRQLNGGSDVDR